MRIKRLVSAIAATAICSLLMPVADIPVFNGAAVVQAEEAVTSDNQCGDDVTYKYSAWQFKEIDMNKWSNGMLYFDYETEGKEGTTTTEGFIVSDFVKEKSSENAGTILSGESTINFNLIILEDIEDVHFTKVYIKSNSDENSPIELSSGAFDPDAEIDEAEYIEIGDFGFDVMD